MLLTEKERVLLKALQKIDKQLEEDKTNLTLLSDAAKPYGYGYKSNIIYEKSYFNDAEHFRNYINKALRNNYNYSHSYLNSLLIKFFIDKCTKENNFTNKAIQLVKEIHDDESLNKFLDFIGFNDI